MAQEKVISTEAETENLRYPRRDANMRKRREFMTLRRKSRR